MNRHAIADKLTEEELENCVDGSTDIALVRRILVMANVIGADNYVDPELFADQFAQALQTFISEELHSDAWNQAYDNNWLWGYDIGDNINMKLAAYHCDLDSAQ